MLLVVGLPLILFKSALPAWLESGAERAVGFVILALAARVMFKWVRGDYRTGAHSHEHPPATDCAATFAAPAATSTRAFAAPARPCRSGSCTGWPERARWCCC